MCELPHLAQSSFEGLPVSPGMVPSLRSPLVSRLSIEGVVSTRIMMFAGAGVPPFIAERDFAVRLILLMPKQFAKEGWGGGCLFDSHGVSTRVGVARHV